MRTQHEAPLHRHESPEQYPATVKAASDGLMLRSKGFLFEAEWHTHLPQAAAHSTV
jgi:hypothetical protein